MCATFTVGQKWTDRIDGHIDIFGPKGRGQLAGQRTKTESVQNILDVSERGLLRRR